MLIYIIDFVDIYVKKIVEWFTMTSRKLVKLGKSSVVVSLPKDWLKEMDLKPGDEIILRKEYDGSLRVLPIKMEKAEIQPELYINIDECKETGSLEGLIEGSYLTGKEVIVIKSSKGFKGEQFKEIRKIVDKIRGLEIVEQSVDKIKLKSFLDPSRFKINLLLKRLASLLTSMFEYFNRGVVEKQTDFLKEIKFIQDEIYRLFLIITRQLISCQLNRELLETTELDNPLQLLENRVIVNYLYDIGVELRNLSSETSKMLDKLDLKRSDIKRIIENATSNIMSKINNWLENYIRKDLNNLMLMRISIDKEIDNINFLLSSPWKAEVDELTCSWIRRMLATFIHINQLFKNVVMSSINTYVIKPPLGCAIIHEKESTFGEIPH